MGRRGPSHYQLTGDSIERGIETRILRLRAFQSAIASAASLPITNDEVLQRIEAHGVAHHAVIEALEGVVSTLKAQHHPPARRHRR